MRAIKMTGPGTLEMREVPIPSIARNEILVRVAAAGVCHSDVTAVDTAGADWPFFGSTLGHEVAGYVAETGADVTAFAEGDPVLVTLMWYCGHCRNCVRGKTNCCLVEGSRSTTTRTPGSDVDGGMADYIRVKEIHADHIGTLDPVTAAPLADAGVTPLHAIKSAREWLTPDATVIVIGVGGLGHLGIQLLKATSPSRILAIDTRLERLELATRCGADGVLLSSESTADKILDLTSGIGANAVFDFVGAAATLKMACNLVAARGALRLIGLGGGSVSVAADASADPLPWGVNVQRSHGGTRQDQRDVISLAQQGRIDVETVVYSLDDYQQAFDDLRDGHVTGRAVLVP